MGTRHLICVVKDGDYKVAQYGQWDGYPGGQGVDILSFLTETMDRETFEAKLDALSWITDDELQKQWRECGATDDSGMVSMEVADKHAKTYPENNRDTGAQILAIIQNSKKPLKLVNQMRFAADSLFCEWAYVVDLDKNTFEVYEGFNKEPLKDDERFFPLDKESNGVELDGEVVIRESEYHPVRLVKSYALADLPPIGAFLADFEEEEDEEW